MPDRPAPPPAPEVWAGVECSIVRVKDTFHRQLEWNGHLDRDDDLDRIAALGIRAFRQPVLWEAVEPEGLGSADWSWADRRLDQLRRLGVRPIVGLVHHGSGPRDTSLVDPGFAPGLAAFARRVAERYPWVEDYTPVNEPLTTARFSGLYGHWYPHGRDVRTFFLALIHQCRGIALAMSAIREVTPRARLVQTEDLGHVFSTPALAYQARYENQRRWLSFDLLRGRVDRSHPFRDELEGCGIEPEDLDAFVREPCTPDILGINHYLTSDRFLDERIDLYPGHCLGGNGHHTYADVEAVRVREEGIAGPLALLRQAWERYGIPLAVTEAHLGCTREEQLRWLAEVWHAAGAAGAEGIDIRAVTAWAVTGSHDWDSLMTRPSGRYESGVFDLSGAVPRPTALAGLVSELAAGGHGSHPVLRVPGWWHHPGRLAYPPVSAPEGPRCGSFAMRGRVRPILILGSGTALGRAFHKECDRRGFDCRLVRREPLDEERWISLLELLQPWSVIDVQSGRDPDTAAGLAAACEAGGLGCLLFSSDQVFDGEGDPPYRESDPIRPLNQLGRRHADLESHASGRQGVLVIRAGLTFGAAGGGHPLGRCLKSASLGLPFSARDDYSFTTAYLPDIAQVALDLLVDRESGIWHLAGPDVISWYDLARLATEHAGLDVSRIHRPTRDGQARHEVRPRRSALASERGAALPCLNDALRRWLIGPRSVTCTY